MKITSKVKIYIEEQGFWKFIWKVLDRLGSFIFSYKPLYLYGTSDLNREDQLARCPLEIRIGGKVDIGLIVKLLDYTDEAFVRNRAENAFSRGAKPFLAFSKDQLTHISWLFYPPIVKEQLVILKLKFNEAHIATCYTSDDFRGMNIYPTVLQHILCYAAENGIERVYIASLPNNIASIRGIEKAGFTKIKTVKGFVLFGKLFNTHWESR
ncbi:MAG: GNAT family N-acetyltransferase [Phycisphaerae bacterium]